ncbi:stage II sporulation protein P [Bacillus solimangrovi]|uniref:Stage II sporulation protein P n=1 Tax=Bacillus solimangrovi TaxID=1305675 RepID=A0A1E5LHZ1_9BACI|nr:stage II sporulation protein P [Bacillus solimangrovi]OEH93685.1 stage II sporulation protein P [Bacillus solimangrovi]
MKSFRSQRIGIVIDAPNVLRLIVYFIVVMLILFICIGTLTSLKPEYRLSSSSVHNWTKKMTGESLVHFFSYENPYFSQALPDDYVSPKLTSMIFESATNINFDDPRSFLGRELPYFSIYDGEILVAGEGTDYTNMPFESAPPIEVLLQEREASLESLKESDKPKPSPVLTTNGKNVVFLYHTHSRESYLPHLPNAKTGDEAYHHEVNVTMVGERLKQELEARGIGTVVDKTDFTQNILSKGIHYSRSYDESRPVIKQAINNNKDLQYFFDIHRDWQTKDNTTVTINEEKYARTFFVIGGEHAKYEKNLQLAKTMHQLLDEKYPGLSRGITTKQGQGTNGKFNQDLSENALVIEMGGVENSLDEVYRTTEALADVFAEYYWQAEKVSQ